MKDYIDGLNDETAEFLREIGLIAEARGWTAYAVGGFVRDVILKRPNLDLDIVVEGEALVLAQEFCRRHSGALTIYRHFGTATVKLSSGRVVDFATARKESYSQPGALPVVQPGSIRDDLFRRDFTINAMALVINPERWGLLVDDFNGLADVRRKTIRILHAQSFVDDPTRILRAVRFEQRLGFTIEPGTLKLLKEALQRGMEKRVKPPRYFEEFRKLLKEKRVTRCLQRLSRLKGLGFFGKKFSWTSRQSTALNRLPAAVAWLQNHHAEVLDPSLIALMVLVGHDKAVRLETLADRFNFSRTEKDHALAARMMPEVIGKLSITSLKPGQICRILDGTTTEMVLFGRITTDRISVRRRLERYLLEWRDVRLQIGGDDLLALGCAAGKDMKIILEEILFRKLEGRIVSRDDEWNAAKALVASLKMR